jgi:hypothetical protein
MGFLRAGRDRHNWLSEFAIDTIDEHCRGRAA